MTRSDDLRDETDIRSLEVSPDATDAEIAAAYRAKLLALASDECAEAAAASRQTRTQLDTVARPLSAQAVLETFQEELERLARRGRDALRDAMAYNRSLIEASIDPLVTIDRDGRISDANDATIRATGVSREELVGSDFSDYFTDPAGARDGYATVFRDGSVRDYELQLRHRDGSTIPVEYNATVYRDAAGNVLGVFAAARDVSARKRAEASARDGMAYNRSLIEASVDPLVTIDRDGRISDVNDATIRATGVPREELVGSDFSDYFTDPAGARAGYSQVCREGSVRDYELLRAAAAPPRREHDPRGVQRHRLPRRGRERARGVRRRA